MPTISGMGRNRNNQFKQISLFPRVGLLQTRNLEADRCTCVFQHQQSALADGTRNAVKFPLTPLLFMESVLWSAAGITIELNLGNWFLSLQESDGKSLWWSHIGKCLGQWGFSTLGINEKTRAGCHTNKASLLGADTVFKVCFHGCRYNGKWSCLVVPPNDLLWGWLESFFFCCFCYLEFSWGWVRIGV